jgi:hypothetical protein
MLWVLCHLLPKPSLFNLRRYRPYRREVVLAVFSMWTPSYSEGSGADHSQHYNDWYNRPVPYQPSWSRHTRDPIAPNQDMSYHNTVMSSRQQPSHVGGIQNRHDGGVCVTHMRDHHNHPSRCSTNSGTLVLRGEYTTIARALHTDHNEFRTPPRPQDTTLPTVQHANISGDPIQQSNPLPLSDAEKKYYLRNGYAHNYNASKLHPPPQQYSTTTRF